MAIKPVQVIRDNKGMFAHPDLPDFGEFVTDKRMKEFELKNGFQVCVVLMEFDSSEEMFNRWFEGVDNSFADWEPTKPADHAFILSIHETEDGPVAWWAIPSTERNSIKGSE